MDDGLLEIIQVSKVTLVMAGDNFGKELHQKLLSDFSLPILYVNVCEVESVAELLPAKKCLLVMEGFGEDGCFENVHIRYGLTNLDLQVVVICRPSVLKQCHDPALFFAPIKNGKLQKKMLARYKLPSLAAVNLSVPHSKVFLKKEAESLKEESKPGQNNSYLNRKLMTRDPLIMGMVADRVMGNEAYKNFLFGLIYASRTDEAMKVAAANAITALNYAGVSFSGMNLSGIKVPEANLAYALFHSTILRNSDLTNVNLRQTYLGRADLSFCKMEGISFSQKKDKTFESAVRCFAWSNTGKWIALAFDNHSVFVIDSVSLKKICVFQDHSKHICNLQFSKDDRYLASASWDETSRVWDISTGKLKHIFRVANTWCHDVQFDPSGKYVVSAWGQGDGSIRFYDIETGIETNKLSDDYIFDIEHIRFTPDGHWLISAQTDSIVVWDMRTYKIAGVLWEHKEGPCVVTCVDISWDGCYFVAVHANEIIYIWDMSFLNDLKSKKVIEANTASLDLNSIIGVIANPQTGFPNFNFNFNFNMDITAKDWGHIPKFTSRISLQGHLGEVTSVQFCGGTHNLISASKDLTIRIWDIHKKKEEQQFVGSKTEVYCVRGRPDGKYLAFSGVDKVFHFFEIYSEPSDALAISQTGRIHVVKTSPNSPLIASGSSDKSVCLWDPRAKRAVKKLNGHNNFISALAFSHDNKYIASGSWDKTVRLWEVATGHVVRQFNYLDKPSDMHIGTHITSLNFSPDGKILATTANWNNDIYLWDVVTGQIKAILKGHKSFVQCIAFNFDGRYLASVCYNNDKRILLWDVLNYQLCLEINKIDLSVNTLQFKPNSNDLILCSETGGYIGSYIVSLFELDPNQTIGVKRKVLLEGYINNFIISRDGMNFAYISYDEIKIGNTRNWRVDCVVEGSKVQINSIDFSNDGIKIVAGTDDGSVKIWELKKTGPTVNQAVLAWVSYPALFVEGCNIEGVFGLSADSRELLESYGAMAVASANNFVLTN